VVGNERFPGKNIIIFMNFIRQFCRMVYHIEVAQQSPLKQTNGVGFKRGGAD
jgi:hypothetical protein